VTGGTRLDRGYLSPYFVTDAERLEVTLEPAHLLLCAQRITALAELVPVLERVAERGAPLLIVAEAIDGDALATLVVNALRGRLRIAAIRAPGFGETRTWALEDLAVLTGARVIDTRAGQRLEDAGLDALGRARRVVVDKETTTVIDGAGPEVGRTAQRRALETALAAAASDATRQRALRERLARFAAGVAVIRVGAPTAVALRAQRARFDDALAATRAALAEGVVTGGGVGLLRAAHALDDLEVTGDEATGIDTVRQALAEPLRRLAVNAGMPGAEVVERVRALPGSMGFNAATRRFEDLDRAGIVDPALVVRSALRNAASIAGLLLTTDAVVTEGGTASGGPDDPGEDDPDRRRGGSGA
jgi:chaperonin GroEL